ncbi:MAG: tRNA (guanosine(37)-N1)-methyltransferase TrmD [Geobacteraceae bacterium GWC2_55_20]|nr:MAG: tRNA (guanosine(37)-N1)-methyltransferase TrmD [Geobacteraceae bacterium GWC2_55_20]OGU26707.1 MAG: tRNA (guanosine(37)-N1)-methyltransferase TrmD [Geobacteraceae bacterium GWF2_54_21]HBA72919.1 tRNA (guanosine(37)-N1)-methyltransferase TrmD [Geobacter sp.]HCE69293.1 tRNA (guanosine(37)-N1)-methyltransferase TrmD [Geobacter sp.]
MRFDILTLFTGMFSGPFDESIIKRAKDKQLIDITLHNIRDYATDRHQTADDAPYGGGAGMVMKAEPLAACITAVKELRPDSTVVLTSPQGRPLTHRVASELAKKAGLIIVCGRYEGIDERIRTLYAEDDISLGDFVLSGGEIAAMAIVDATTRLIPGVLGSCESAGADSFGDGLLEYPQYTRPPLFMGIEVPPALLSGNHELIRKWRRKESLRKTRLLRPDLLPEITLTKEDLKMLHEIAREDDRGM